MATKKLSELTSVDPSADLTKTYIPVYDEVTSSTRKISLQQINDAVELSIPFAQAAFNVANTATASVSAAEQKSLAAGAYANAAYLRANSSLNVSSGGTITGDLTLTGNLSITGCTASLVVSTFRTSDAVIDLSYGTSGSPTQNAGVRILRGDEPSTQLRWNESSNKWEFTNDGSTYYGIAASWIEGYSTSSYTHANAAFGVANTAAAGDQYSRDHANNSYIHANASFAAANSGNTYAISVDNKLTLTTSNLTYYSIKTNSVFDVANSTSINVSIVSSYTNSAYSLANVANNMAYASQDNIPIVGSYANSAYITANSASSYANGAFTTANIAVPAASYANGAFTTANIAIPAASYANGAFNAANTAQSRAVQSGDYANGAFTKANTSSQQAITSGSYANSAFDTANTAEAALLLYDSRITIAADYANSSFIQANVADQRAVTSGSYANSAYNKANTGSSGIANSNYSFSMADNGNISLKYNDSTSAIFSSLGIVSYGQMSLEAANNISGNNSSILFDRNGGGIVLRFETSDPSYKTWGFYQDNVLFPDGTRQYTAVNNTLAQSAFDKANNALANTSGMFAGNLTVQGKVYTQKLIYTGNTTVTQTTSRNNGITLNSSFGDVVLYESSMTAGQVDAIAVNNNKAVAGDLIVCSVLGNPGTYIAGGYCSVDGLVILWIKNITASSTSAEQPIIKFALIQPSAQ